MLFKIFQNSIRYIYANIHLLYLIIPAAWLYMLVIVPSASNFCYVDVCGYHFWGVHDHDGLWNIAIAQVGFPHIPPLVPTFAGELLRGYNYLLDYLIYLAKVVFHISPLITYFKIIPPTWFITQILLLIALARAFNQNKRYILIFLIIALLASPYAAILTYAHYHTIWGSSALMSSPIIHTMTNFHFALSLLLHSFLLIYLKSKSHALNLHHILVLSVVTFLLLGFKFYGGAAAIVLIGTYILMFPSRFVAKLPYFEIYLLISVCSIFFWYQPNLSSASMFIWSPFAIFNKISEEPNQFYLHNLTNARYFLESYGLSPRLFGIYGINTMLFLFFNLGIRFFGLLYYLYLGLRKRLNRFDISIGAVIIFTILMPTLFIQRDDWWNTMQFFDIATYLLTIYTAQWFFVIWERRILIFRVLLLTLLILSIIPTIDIVRTYLFLAPRKNILTQEIDALRYLEKLPKGVVHVESDLEHTRDTAYVTALSGKQTYLQNPHMVSNLKIQIESRTNQIVNNPCKTLEDVQYIYTVGNQEALTEKYSKCSKSILQLFSNDLTKVFKVQ